MDKRQKILIVDDAEFNRVILKEILGETYNYLEAENGNQAIQIGQVFLCQFPQHIIRLMKNFRQMRNTFLINSFRHKSKISENHQSNAHKTSYKDSYL